jgi:hypothetical protein
MPHLIGALRYRAAQNCFISPLHPGSEYDITLVAAEMLFPTRESAL